MTLDVTYIVVVLVTVLVSMTIHEAMHAYVSYWLGDDTAQAQGRLTLNPLAHIDPFMTLILPVVLAVSGLPPFGAAKPVPFNPQRVRYGEFGAAMVGLAGPLTNFILAFLLFAVYVFSGTPGGLFGGILITGVGVNLGFFVFNMLPVPPLDGSRLLYALAPDWVRRGMEKIETYGIVVVFVLLLLAGSYVGSFMGSAIEFFFHLFESLFGI